MLKVFTAFSGYDSQSMALAGYFLLLHIIKVPHTHTQRLLTPRECFRLMDVAECYIDKMLQNKVKQLYLLAGNSIVVAVLENVFYKLFINTTITNKNLFNYGNKFQ